jgi:hypothetical protein
MIYLTQMERPATKRSYPYNGLEAELGGSAETPKVGIDPVPSNCSIQLVNSFSFSMI